MDTQEPNNHFRPPAAGSRALAGGLLLLVGVAFLLRELNFSFFPDWMFTWPMILIVVGVYIGIKHDFRGPGWMILLIIGSIFLADQADFGFDLHRFLVPAIIIAAGLIMILRPKPWNSEPWQQWRRGRRGRWDDDAGYSGNTGTADTGAAQPASVAEPAPAYTRERQRDYDKNDYIDSTSVFAGIKKVIVSKNFKGGEITCFMGGAEVDLTQADINGTAVLDVTCVLGGAKLIVPAHWTIKSEMSAIFGGIEDKRKPDSNLEDPGKVLLIKGTCFMGGFEFRSY